MMIVAEGDMMEAVKDRVNATLTTVPGHIRGLGLQLTVNKREAVVFTRRCGLGKLQIGEYRYSLESQTSP